MSATTGANSYLVECFWPGVSSEQAAAAARRAQRAARGLRRHGRAAHFLGSILIPDDEMVFCLFEGSEADVRTASEQAGVPFERVLESVRIAAGRLFEEPSTS